MLAFHCHLYTDKSFPTAFALVDESSPIILPPRIYVLALLFL